MTTIEETQDDEVIEQIEKAQLEAKRSKTKYGDQIDE